MFPPTQPPPMASQASFRDWAAARVIPPLSSFVSLVYFVVLTLAVFAVPSAQADSPVVFNEIMYHPATNESQLEWVELQNQMSVDVDLSGWALDSGIHFTFPSGTVIKGGNF